ncbi:MAG: hypothetical protein ABIZ57_01240 [Candidatus Limnocylindria bacterium]
MNDRDLDQLLDAWMDLGPGVAPARVAEAVRLEARSTRQTAIPVWWPQRRFPEMNKSLTYAAAAAAVVIVAILSITFLAPGGLNVGGPAETPTPSPAPSPVVLPASETNLAAGTYGIDELFPFRVTFVVPDGWFSCSPGDDEIGACARLTSDSEVSMGIAFVNVDNVIADPCDRSDAQLDPPVGPSVDDLVTAISNLQGFDATDASDVTVDGFSGKQFELTAPAGDSGCVVDGDGFGTWTTPSRTNGVGPGEVNLLRVLDVDGVRLVVTAAYHPALASAEEVAEIRRVFESIHIAP